MLTSGKTVIYPLFFSRLEEVFDVSDPNCRSKKKKRCLTTLPLIELHLKVMEMVFPSAPRRNQRVNAPKLLINGQVQVLQTSVVSIPYIYLGQITVNYYKI
ncbi:hypothetical protein L1987_61866 [Smallanthus sonchifolius]|uniref:Uncharacterized protein n=1 Tax=Smallanthus sonchifolius TaxID=185202 RepID=A0ACB9C8X8_9ASTR|nr:hypothetical protein L1987_61866 [Smallanthus sonchifolius]